MAIGLVSVIPHACHSSMPRTSRYASINVAGTADPPHTAVLMLDTSAPVACTWLRIAVRIVGTPPVNVGRSWRMKSQSPCGCRNFPREQQVAAHHPACVWRAPRVDVKHRHDDEQPAVVVEAERPPHREGVQEHGAVAVCNAFRVAGRSRRVAHGRRAALVDGGPVEGRRLRGEQRLVGKRVRRDPTPRAEPTTITCSTLGH